MDRRETTRRDFLQNLGMTLTTGAFSHRLFTGGLARGAQTQPRSATRLLYSDADINRSTWQPPQTVTGGGTLELNTPGKGHGAVVVRAR